FLWEEEIATPEAAPRGHRESPSGAAPGLRKATQFALTAVLATSLAGQIIGVRLVAPVDAAPDHACQRACRATHYAELDACKLLATRDAQVACALASDAKYNTCAIACGF